MTLAAKIHSRNIDAALTENASNLADHSRLVVVGKDNHIAPGQVFAGTDYPYLIEQREPAAFIGSVAGTVARGDTLWSGAARRFLGLDAP